MALTALLCVIAETQPAIHPSPGNGEQAQDPCQRHPCRQAHLLQSLNLDCSAPSCFTMLEWCRRPSSTSMSQMQYGSWCRRLINPSHCVIVGCRNCLHMRFFAPFKVLFAFCADCIFQASLKACWLIVLPVLIETIFQASLKAYWLVVLPVLIETVAAKSKSIVKMWDLALHDHLP